MTNEIGYLIELNRKHAELFAHPSAARALAVYRSQHPTRVAALKCMDGRLHVPLITEVPLGIIQPFRNLGGKFNMGWPYFQDVLSDWDDDAREAGEQALLLVTYHYAAGDVHRGCRGFNYDVEASKAEMADLRNEIVRRMGIHAVLWGIETDLDALILHGENGEVVDLSKQPTNTSSSELLAMLRGLYPSLPGVVVNDMLPLVEGNIRHIAEVRRSNRPITDAEHREWVLGIGRGFDWLHEINTALIVGPFEPNLSTPIEVAARLLEGNLRDGRLNGRGIVLLSSAPYWQTAGKEPQLAEAKARFLSAFARDVITREVPELLPRLQILTGIVDMNTRRFKVLEEIGSVV